MKRQTGRPLEVETTNVLMEGVYTTRIEVGSQPVSANVLLDTGSSTLALASSVFQAKHFVSTTLAQEMEYGAGSWRGAVVRTPVRLASAGGGIGLDDVHAALVLEGKNAKGGPLFDGADGILGLAYCDLNPAKDLGKNTDTGFTDAEFGSGTLTEVEPYFTELERLGVIANKFAFYALRSSIHYGTADPATDPLNKGRFILGGGEEATNLYRGTFESIEITHDLYYNTNLKGIVIDGKDPIEVPKASTDPSVPSNSIVDTGVPDIVLPQAVFSALSQRLPPLPPNGRAPVSEQELDAWPSITLVFEGHRGDVPLRLDPSTYWQLRASKDGGSEFKIIPGDLPLVIVGLPLMNNYFTIFDRSADEGLGEIRFAPIATPG